MEKNISDSKKKYKKGMDLTALTIQCMVVEKIVLSKQMKEIQKQNLKSVKLIRWFQSFIIGIKVKL